MTRLRQAVLTAAALVQAGSRSAAAWRLLSALAVAHAAAGCRCDEQPAITAESQQLLRLKTEATWFAMQLVQIRTAVPRPAGLQEQPCSDEQLKTELDGGYGRMLLADYAYLERYERPELDPYAGPHGPWKVLTAAALRAIDPPQPIVTVKQATNTLYGMQQLQKSYRHLAVLRTTRRELPRIEGTRFHPGVLEGWLVVVELGRALPLCHAQVHAESSQQVAGLEGQDRDRAVWRDFERRLEQQLNDAAKRMTRRLLLVTD
jgi:hypothetical protein